MTSIPKTDITADVSAIIDGQPIDAADVRTPIEDLLAWIRAGHGAVSGTDTHVKTLADGLTVSGRLTLTVTNPGGDEVAEIALDDTGIVTVNGVQTLENKTLVEPVIASFLNAQHDHSDAENGGQLDASDVFDSGTVPVARLPVIAVGQAGIAPEPAGGDANKALFGDGTYRSTAPTIASVGLSMPGDLFDVTGSPVTATGTLAAALKSQAQNQVWASPDGTSGAPSFRALGKSDLPALNFNDLDLTGAPFAPIVPWVTLGSAASAINLTSIPGGYGSLLLMLVLRSAVNATSDTLRLRMNSDSGSNYDAQRALLYHNAQFSTSEAMASAYMQWANVITGATATNGHFAVLNIWLHGYGVSSRPRPVMLDGALPLSASSGDLRAITGLGMWKNSAAAINALAISAAGGNLAAGSSYALYGVGS